ncbi:hypothetical protein PHMEG_00012150 [Phytophthora megakarya]|uniref:Uncharacterized protein n=1 Tax=Phytophthora megakarya TaxID=4795 RepID=A0A225WBK3_9STRA|nr:hypothetical protein PHMEG_00012150 [Phytophthora megakarya]
MIICQHSKRNTPLVKHLKDVYWQSRRVADRLGVLSGQHHLRAYNKMVATLD